MLYNVFAVAAKTEPRVTFDNYAKASIDDFHADFARIWERDARDRSAFDLWLHVVDHASRIARAVRRQRPPEVIDDVADTTVWLLSFIAHCGATAQDVDEVFKLRLQPSKILWRKYPAACPACFDSWILSYLDLSSRATEDVTARFVRSESVLNAEIQSRVSKFKYPEGCTCLTRLLDHRAHEVRAVLRPNLDESRLSYATMLDKADKRVHRISELEDMFQNIYANVHHVLSLDTIVFHFLEEIGEATQALKDCYTYDDCREPFSTVLLKARQALLLDELADVLSWLFAVALKIRATYELQAGQYRASIRGGGSSASDVSFRFAHIIWSKYGMTSNGANWDRLKCPGCRSAPCECSRDLKIRWSPAVTGTKAVGGPMTDLPEQKERDLVFVSYSHKDVDWLDRLQTMLKPLVKNKTVSSWADSHLKAGQLWRPSIESALGRAKVAVLLVSSDFLSSDFIEQHELPPLLEASRTHGTAIIWVPVRDCLWSETEIGNYQAAHDPKKPLASLTPAEQDAALVKICQTIKEAAQQP